MELYVIVILMPPVLLCMACRYPELDYNNIILPSRAILADLYSSFNSYICEKYSCHVTVQNVKVPLHGRRFNLSVFTSLGIPGRDTQG